MFTLTTNSLTKDLESKTNKEIVSLKRGLQRLYKTRLLTVRWARYLTVTEVKQHQLSHLHDGHCLVL